MRKSEKWSAFMTRKSAAIDGLNPSSNFRYLLSTQQQQVVDSVEVPPLPSFHKFSAVYFALQNECASRHTKAWTRDRGEKRKLAAHVSTSALWNIPDGPKKVGSTLNKRNFRIPLRGLANETVPSKKYLVATFKKDIYLKIKENNQIDYRHHTWLKSSSFGSIY